MAGRWKEGGGRRGVTLPGRVARGTAMKRSWRRPLLYSGAYVLIGWIARARNSSQPPVGHFNRRDRSFRVFAGVKTLPPHPLGVGWTAWRTGRYSYLVRAGERASTTPPLTRGPKTPMFSRHQPTLSNCISYICRTGVLQSLWLWICGKGKRTKTQLE